MTIKNDITKLCKRIAEENDGWAYSSVLFKKKIDKNLSIFVDMRWSFRSGGAAGEPYAGLYLPNIEKVYKSIGEESFNRTFLEQIKRPDNALLTYRHTIWDLQKDDAEGYIRDVFRVGRALIDQRYCLDSQESLIRNLPAENNRPLEILEGGKGVKYCIAQMLIGDFDYIQRYYYDEIETKRQKQKEVLEKLIARIPEFKKNWEAKGTLV